MGLDGISFLPADVSSPRFGRDEGSARVLATRCRACRYAVELGAVVEDTIAHTPTDLASGFVAESPAKLRRLPQYYRGPPGSAPFPPVSCNAPWISVVVEADGSVRPCFFHPRIGNVRQAPLPASSCATGSRRFDATLDVGTNPVCGRCVCSMKTGLAGGAVELAGHAMPALEETRTRSMAWPRPTTDRTPEPALRGDAAARARDARRARACRRFPRARSGLRTRHRRTGPRGERLPRHGHRLVPGDGGCGARADGRCRARCQAFTSAAPAFDEARLPAARGIRCAPTSNFGPLNCVANLPTRRAPSPERLRPGGVLVASVIGRVCPWEIALYLREGISSGSACAFPGRSSRCR